MTLDNYEKYELDAGLRKMAHLLVRYIAGKGESEDLAYMIILTAEKLKQTMEKDKKETLGVIQESLSVEIGFSYHCIIDDALFIIGDELFGHPPSRSRKHSEFFSSLFSWVDFERKRGNREDIKS
jgi:hypothetical protein